MKIKDVLDHEAPLDAGGDNVYEVTVQVTDGADEDGKTDTSVDDSVNVSITVADVNEPPEFAVTALDLVLVENTKPGAVIGSVVLAVDPESDSLAYSLAGADSGLFDFESSTGQISAGATAVFDMEKPSDANADNIYELLVQVTDGVDEDGNPDTTVDTTMRLAITVSDVNEPPVFELSSIKLELAENTEARKFVGDPVVAVDPESTYLTYRPRWR